MQDKAELTGDTPQEQDEGTFDRLRLILGDEGIERLAGSTVAVLGLGGVGSNCAMALARGGVGHLVLLDRDCVTPSNINRQAVARRSTLGRPKAEVMREMVLDVNPKCEVTALRAFLNKDRIDEQMAELPDPDWTVDAIDTVSQKLRIALWAQESGHRLISSMGAGNKLDPTRLHIADISETYADPIARTVRKECRKRGIEKLEVVFSDETPMHFAPPADAELLSDGRPADRGVLLGTMSYMPAMMGYTIAGRVICGLLGVQNELDPFRTW